MFPSSNNGNVDPIYYSDQQGYSRFFFNDINPNYKHDHQDDLPFSFFHLQSTPFSPWFDESELQDHHDLFLHQSHDLLLHQQQQQTMTATGSVNMDSNNSNDANSGLIKICSKRSHNGTSGSEQIIKHAPRKRSSKRDRHSKINTAQGPRDRRMRLSLKVAREFFDLQDKLCFDKASKTVEWLLIQARSAIKKLSSTGLSHQMNNYSCSVGTKSASSTSECEVVSRIDDAAIAIKGSKISRANKPSSLCVNTGKKTKQLRRIAYHPLARESREKARARARERTREKQQSRRSMDNLKLCDEGKNHELNQLTGWNPFETGGEESGAQSHTISMDILADIEEAPISYHDQQQDRSVTAEGVIDDSLVIMGKWSPSFIINHLCNTSTPQETHHQIDLQSFCKSWEAA